MLQNCSLDDNLYCVDSLKIFKEHEENLTLNAAMDEFLKTDLIDVQRANESTPSRGSSKFKSSSKLNHERSNVARCLFPVNSSEKIDNAKKPPKNRISFKLTDIYERLHGHQPETAHNAEADTIHLLKCAIAINDSFVQLADSLAVKFNDII